MNGFGTFRRRRTRRTLDGPDSRSMGDKHPFIAPGLPAASLTSFRRSGRPRATIEIPPYVGMAEGDRIVVAWENRFIALEPLTTEQVGSPIVASIPSPFKGLEAMRDVRISWRVLNVADPTSRWAPTVYAPLRVSGSFAPTPWLEGTEDDAGHVYRVMDTRREEVLIRAEGHFAKIGDRVILHCASIMPTGKADTWSSPLLRLGRDGQTLDIPVPLDILRRAAGGCCTFHYTTYGYEEAMRPSFRRRIDVVGPLGRFAAPKIQQAEGAVLDPVLADGGVIVEVPPWPGLADDDECQLFWTGTCPDGKEISYTDKATGSEARAHEGLTFPVPPSEVLPLDGGMLRVCYQVKTFVKLETPEGSRRECIHTLESAALELRVQKTVSPPSVVIDNLNGLSYRRIDQLKRPYITFTPVDGRWTVRGGHDGVPPFHEGTFLCSADERAAICIEFAVPCTSVRFGYGANGSGGNGSLVHIDIFDTKGEAIGEAVYTVPLSGLPGLWIHLHSMDYGATIGSIVIRKDTTGVSERVIAQIDNFTLTR